MKLIIDKETYLFATLDELKSFVANKYCIQTFQINIEDNNVILNNKLGESFAYIGIIEY